MSFSSSGNVSVEASQESVVIDNHINTDTSENSDDSLHLSQTESETDDKEVSQCKNKKFNVKIKISKFTM